MALAINQNSLFQNDDKDLKLNENGGKDDSNYVSIQPQNAKVYRADVIEFLSTLENESVDLITTDPAYSGMNQHLQLGSGRIIGKYSDKANSGKWFEEFHDTLENYATFLSECSRVLKNNRHIYIMFDSYSLLTLAPLVREYFDVKNLIAWDKVNIGMGHYFRRRHEFVVFASKGKKPINARNIPDVWRFKRVMPVKYPTQKPVEIFDAMINASSEKDYLVCDPFAGSGSSAIAALKNDCRFVGCDVSENAVNLAKKRISTFIENGSDILQTKSMAVESKEDKQRELFFVEEENYNKIKGMANLSKSYALFGFTSPRTIEKIIPEIKLLIENFSGEEWKGNSELQSNFFDVLFDSEFYDGETKPEDKALAARDRITRAPKALGFVNLEPKIELTGAGSRLLSGNRTNEIITRQLLKFQLPSPYHTDNKNRFFVKPYLELLRLVAELDGLSKTEIALFFSQLTRLDKYEAVKKKILDFRAERKRVKTNRKEFVQKRFVEEIEEIYEAEIEAKGYRTRESADATPQKFFKTKQNNMRDYADAFIRYLRATELVTFNARQARLVVSKFKADEVSFILRNTAREPKNFTRTADFKKYLFDASAPALLTDDRKLLTEKIVRLDKSKDVSTIGAEQLKDVLAELEEEHKTQIIQIQKQKLKTYEELPDILEVFERIKNKELPDAPLFLEWNIWRAMEMLNYGQIDGNFITDLDGAPLSTAAGNRPDIECEYENFKLIIEVTMSRGNKQYEMEGEPVARHYGNVKRESSKPVYCLFVAPQVSEGTLTYYFSQNQINTKFYGGKTQIVPMNLETFIEFAKTGVKNKFSQITLLEKFFSQAIKTNSSAENEEIWFNDVETMAKNWTSLN